ncbi:hypothetical protein [Anaerococcus hydrogenalis]|nr:hypothetical protein [Anaerococcus hydrogenalis]
MENNKMKVNKSLILAIAVCSLILPSSSHAEEDNLGLKGDNIKNAPIVEPIKNNLNTKKHDFANMAKETENAVNETNTEINNTKTKEEQITEIDNKVNDLTEEKNNLENKIEEDKTEVKLKEENNKILEEKLQNATTKMNELDTKRQEIVSDKNATEKDIEKANKEYEELKAKYEKAKNDVSKFTEQDKARLKELEKDYKEEKKSGLRFFEKNGDEATKNEIKNASEKDSGFTDQNGKKQSQLEMATELDEEYSAFGIDNMITAAETLVQVNKDREKAGLPKLNTSHYMQFLAGLKVEGDRRVNTHYKQIFAGLENLAWSDAADGFKKSDISEGITSDSFYLWFYNEKDKVINAAKKIDPNAKLKTNKEVYEFVKAHKKELNKHLNINDYGHFQNLMNSADYYNQGMAFAKSSAELRNKMGDFAGKYNNILNNAFMGKGWGAFADPEDAELMGLSVVENIMTPEELLEQLKSFKETDAQLKNEYEALSKKAISGDNSALVNALAEQLKASQEKMAKLQEKLQEATTNLEQATNELGATTHERGQLAVNIAKTNSEINDLKEEINTSIEKVNDIKKQINDLNDKKAKIQGTEEPGEKDPEEKPGSEEQGEKDPEEKPGSEEQGEKDPEEKPGSEEPGEKDPEEKSGKKDPTKDQKPSEPDKNKGLNKEEDTQNNEKDKKSEIKDKKKNPTENKSESLNQKNNPVIIKKYSNNVKTGVPSLGAVLTLLNFSTFALFKSKKENKKDI